MMLLFILYQCGELKICAVSEFPVGHLDLIMSCHKFILSSGKQRAYPCDPGGNRQKRQKMQQMGPPVETELVRSDQVRDFRVVVRKELRVAEQEPVEKQDVERFQ